MVPVRSIVAMLASVFFGLAIVPEWGTFTYLAMTFVFVGLFAVGWLFRTGLREVTPSWPVRRVQLAVWATLLVLATFTAWTPEHLLYPEHDWSVGRGALWVIAALIATHGLSFVREEPRWLRTARFVGLAGAVLVMGVTTYVASSSPAIDVWTVQQQGAVVLSEGRNPFQDVHLIDSGPRTADDVPYVYPPLHLLLSTAVWAVFGDVRFTMLLALILTGFAARALAIRASGGTLPSILEDAPALLIWCTPRLPFILEQGWIDPVPLALFSALLLAWKRPWLAAVLAGLVLGGKQTMILVVFPVGLAIGFTWRHWLVAAVTLALPIAPWALWDFAAWKHSNFDFLSALPVRDDALTVVTWAKRRLKLTIPPVTGFVSATLVLAFATWKRQRTLEYAAIVAVTAMTCFFVFNKWAFANYYFTLLGLSALTAATWLRPASSPPP